MMHIQLKILLILLGLILSSQRMIYAAECHGQNILSKKNCIGDNLDIEEKNLYNMINQYRKQNGLPSIPSSPSLNLVANRHVRDVAENSSLYSRNGQNWLHGWSNCPYDANNQNTLSCIWEAPKRLGTPYPGLGFENFCGSPEARYQNFTMTAEYALKTWQKSMWHNATILNQGTWQKYKWNAIGIAIYKGYASLWFGAEHDPLSSVEQQSPAQPKLPYPSQRQSQGFLGIEISPSKFGGIIVKKVYTGSPAHREGLQSGDILTHIDNRIINSVQGFVEYISMNPGRTVYVNGFRNGSPINGTLTIGVK